MGKENIKLSTIILLLIVISLSSTYAYLQLSATSNNANGTGGCFEVEYSGGQAITDLPLATNKSYDNTAQIDAQLTVSLSKDESCKIYTEASIYLHTDSAGTTAPLDNGSMKYAVMNGDTQVSSGTVAAPTSANKGEQVLATVTLTETVTNYTIKLWIDAETSKGTFNDTEYSGYVYATSIQSSTITK